MIKYTYGNDRLTFRGGAYVLKTNCCCQILLDQLDDRHNSTVDGVSLLLGHDLASTGVVAESVLSSEPVHDF